MDFLDNVSKVLNSTAKKAVKVSGDVVDYTKLTVAIRNNQIKIDSFYKEIGRAAYKKYTADIASVPEDIGDYCRCIAEIKESIASLRERAAALKGIKICPKCGASLDLKFEYCPSCGDRQPVKEAAATVEPAQEECSCGCGTSSVSTEDTCSCSDSSCGCSEDSCGCSGGCECPDEQPSNCAPDGVSCCPDEDTLNYEGEGTKVVANELSDDDGDMCCKDGVCGIKADGEKL